jgi:hypothetical protein
MSMGPPDTLRMVFEADAWDSTISFASGIPVTLGATRELSIADDVNLARQTRRSLKFFDGTGLSPTGVFAVASQYAWDLSNLYTTDDVSLTAVPESSPLFMFTLCLATLIITRRGIVRRLRGGVQEAARLIPLMTYACASRPDIFSWRRREIHEILRIEADALIGRNQE